MLYRLAAGDRERARALIQLYALAGGRLAEHAPRAEVVERGSVVRFRWVGVGRRYIHPVYVVAAYDRGRRVLVLSNRPAYPAYLMALAGALHMAGLHTAVVARVSDAEVRAVLSPDYDHAVSLAAAGLASTRLVSPRRFLDLDVSFEGYLYRVPVGYVAFETPKPLKQVDVIEDHEEYENWASPVEVAKNIVERVVSLERRPD